MNQWINWSVQHLLSPFPAQSGILVEDPWCHSTETYPQWALSMVLESRQAPKVLECKVPKASKHECSEEGAIIVETSGNCSGMGIGGSRNTTWWSIDCGIKKRNRKTHSDYREGKIWTKSQRKDILHTFLYSFTFWSVIEKLCSASPGWWDTVLGTGFIVMN